MLKQTIGSSIYNVLTILEQLHLETRQMMLEGIVVFIGDFSLRSCNFVVRIFRNSGLLKQPKEF